MLDYSKDANPLNLQYCPPNIDFKLDELPLAHPYVPRICNEQGHFLLWWGTSETDTDLVMPCLHAKNEPQWITCNEEWKIEKGVALIYPYNDEIIIGALKVPGYYHLKRPVSNQRRWLKKMWRDVIDMFGDRRIVCPSGGYINKLHLAINKEQIPRESYHQQLMKSLSFIREGDFWIRYPQ
jgi:hypothetical protein